MTDRGTLESTIADFYESRGNLDLAKSMSYFEEDCYFRIAGTDELGPFTQPTHTRAQLTDAARALFDNWDLKGLKTVSAFFDGDVVLVHRAGSIMHRPSNKTFDTEMMDKLTFKDGKIVEYLQFLDTYGIAKVADFGAA